MSESLSDAHYESDGFACEFFEDAVVNSEAAEVIGDAASIDLGSSEEETRIELSEPEDGSRDAVASSCAIQVRSETGHRGARLGHITSHIIT